MSTPNNRRRDPGGFGGETLMLLVLVVVVVGGLVVTNVAVRLGAQLDGTAAEPPSDPFGLTLGVILARVAWPASAIWIVAVLGAILLVLTVLVIVGVVRHRKGRTRVDRASSYMGRGKDVAGLSRQNAVQSAERLGAKDVDGKSVLRAERASKAHQVASGSWLSCHAGRHGDAAHYPPAHARLDRAHTPQLRRFRRRDLAASRRRRHRQGLLQRMNARAWVP